MHIVTAKTVARGANPLGGNQSLKLQAFTENVKEGTSQQTSISHTPNVAVNSDAGELSMHLAVGVSLRHVKGHSSHQTCTITTTNKITSGTVYCLLGTTSFV